MAEIDVNRSVHFISLDTHPANNALTVTYEIIVSVIDRNSKRELARRSKRDQHQIHISALDQLNDRDLISDKLTINLQDLSLQIIKRCPMLQSERHNLEDIQLHLLYLVNRRRSLLLSGANNDNRERSSSSNSRRLNSGASSGRQSAKLYGSRGGTAGQRRLSSSANGSGFKDVYNYLLAKESTVNSQQAEDGNLEEFLCSFNDYLSEMEIGKWPNLNKYSQSHLIVPEELERLLEELYGTNEEREESMCKIRKIVQVDANLYYITSNSLLISALLRTLRDQDAKSNYISESILFCVLKMSSYSDTFESLCANTSDQTDLFRILVGLLGDNSKLLVASSELRFVIAQYYLTNSLLVLLENLIICGTSSRKSSDSAKVSVKQVSFKQYVQQITEFICALCKTFSTHLAAGIRMPIQNEKITMLFGNLISIMRRVSVYNDFIRQLRLKQNIGSIEFLLDTLNCLQLSRPGSGVSFNEQLDHVHDKATLNEIYELEINVIKVIINLLFDQRLKQNFIRKNLVKCVLRNLVVFLASRKSNTLSPYHRSSVLITPFKCLYELSCSLRVRKELFKSKIIIKCLLEYLLSCTSQLKYALSLVNDERFSSNNVGNKTDKRLNEDQYPVTIEPGSAEYYIIAIWVNLSACNEATFCRNNVELRELICEYFELAIKNLHTLLSMTKHISENYVLVFMHLKLIRNLSQFMDFNQEPMLWIDPYMRWLDLIGSAAERLLLESGEESAMMSVECVAIMSNWVSKRGQFEDLKIIPTSDWPKSTKNLLSALFKKDLCNLDADNDDLIMVTVNLLGNLARYCEICDEIADIRPQIIGTFNYVLETKTTDQEMIVCTLYTLTQLMNHTSFLNMISNATSGPIETSVKKLIHNLSDFLLHRDSTIVGLAVSILIVLKQLDDDSSMTESLVYGMRFMAYNNRWLKMIQAHMDDGISSDDVEEQFGDGENADATSEEISSDVQLNLAESEDLGQQVVTFDGGRSARRASQQSDQIDTESRSTRDDDKSREAGLDLEDDNDELDYEDEDIFDEPDLNVIDAKSMIKHLTTRKEFRSNWSNNK